MCIRDRDKEDILRRTEKNLGRIEALQDKLYADGRESVLIILQAMDAAGKDSTVKHVMGLSLIHIFFGFYQYTTLYKKRKGLRHIRAGRTLCASPPKNKKPAFSGLSALHPVKFLYAVVWPRQSAALSRRASRISSVGFRR